MDEWILPKDRIIKLPSEALKEKELREKEKKKLEENKKKEENKDEIQIDNIEIELNTDNINNSKINGKQSKRSKKESKIGITTRGQKRKREDNDPDAYIGVIEHDEHEGLDEASLKEHEEITKVKNIHSVELGKYRMQCWYFSPFPREITENGPVQCLYFCEFTLRFFLTKEELLRYQQNILDQRFPPGDEIWRQDNLSMFEIDGASEKIYCQNLCYLAKLFLDHKTLYYDVDPFLFYVLCERDDRGYHIVGYYSKEKLSDLGYNLACILIFPAHQRKGYGRVLIQFSYELSKIEKKVGSPEKPLSDLGAVSYRSYWCGTLLRAIKSLKEQQKDLTILELCRVTSIMPNDVTQTLLYLGILRGTQEHYILSADDEFIDKLLKRYPQKGIIVNPELIHWTPFVTGTKRDKFHFASKRPTTHET